MHARLRTAILPEGVAEDLHVGEHPVAAALDPVELAQRAAGDPPREAAPLDTPSFVVAPAPHRVLVHQLVDRAGLPVDGVTALLALLQLRRVVQHLHCNPTQFSRASQGMNDVLMSLLASSGLVDALPACIFGPAPGTSPSSLL